MVSFVATKLRRRNRHACTDYLTPHSFCQSSRNHAKRLTSLLAAVEAVVMGSRLTLSDMGRGLSGSVAVKHNIKRIDRLLGNSMLHTEIPKLYEVLVRQSLEDISTPLIVIDWSDLTADRHWQLLRASVAIEGRSRPCMNKYTPNRRQHHRACIRRFSPGWPPCCRQVVRR